MATVFVRRAQGLYDLVGTVACQQVTIQHCAVLRDQYTRDLVTVEKQAREVNTLKDSLTVVGCLSVCMTTRPITKKQAYTRLPANDMCATGVGH